MLVSEKFPDREENRRDILDTVHALIAEGERVHPQQDPEIQRQQAERKAAREQQKGVPVPVHRPGRFYQLQVRAPVLQWGAVVALLVWPQQATELGIVWDILHSI